MRTPPSGSCHSPSPPSPSLIQFHLGSGRYGGGDEEGQRGEEIKEGKAVKKESSALWLIY